MSSRSGGAQLAGLKLYGRMPPLMRQRFVRAVKPSFTVGTMSVVTKPDGAILLVRHSYLANWSFPGGLLNRRELPSVGAARETREEVGIRIELAGEPAVVVDPYKQVVRVIYRAALAEWRCEADPLPRRPPRWHPRAAAVALGLADGGRDVHRFALRLDHRDHVGERLIELRDKDSIAAVAKVDAGLSEEEEQPLSEDGAPSSEGEATDGEGNGTELDNGSPEA